RRIGKGKSDRFSEQQASGRRGQFAASPRHRSTGVSEFNGYRCLFEEGSGTHFERAPRSLWKIGFSAVAEFERLVNRWEIAICDFQLCAPFSFQEIPEPPLPLIRRRSRRPPLSAEGSHSAAPS